MKAPCGNFFFFWFDINLMNVAAVASLEIIGTGASLIIV